MAVTTSCARREEMKRFYKLLLALLLSMPLSALAGTAATLYKNPNCGCCEGHAEYLRENGFDVEIIPTHDLAAIKQEHRVPEALAGCHTTLVGNYVFEGHVPVESINRVLEERPMIKGLTVPGMPAGSPGMGGAKRGPLHVYYLGDGERPKIYASH
jgi:hypothetical protein